MEVASRARNTATSSSRDASLDCLRFIGLALIVLAHVGPPAAVFQIRNLDVPLMVMLSGAGFMISPRRVTYLTYLRYRIVRLVVPVWVFLSLYFCALWLFSAPPSPRIVFESLALLEGIGYVWIIRVFLLVAIIAPALRVVDCAVCNNWSLLFLWLLVILLSEVCKSFAGNHIPPWARLTVQYMIPYGAVFAIGMRIPRLSRKEFGQFLSVVGAIFVLYLFVFAIQHGRIIETQSDKYPPGAYYLSYAVFSAGILWGARYFILELISKVSALRSVVLFAAANSIWVYLWHIALLPLIPARWDLKFLLVLGGSILITSVQVYLVRVLVAPKFKSARVRSALSSTFTG